MRFKYGNHDEVVSFGKNLILENISKVSQISLHGDVSISRNLIDGINILSRLCDVKTKKEFKLMMTEQLSSQRNDLFSKQQHMNEFYFKKSLKQIEDIEHVIENSQLEIDKGY